MYKQCKYKQYNQQAYCKRKCQCNSSRSTVSVGVVNKECNTKKNITNTALLWTLRCYGHPTITNTSLLRTLHYYRHPTITDTPLLLTPHYYGHPTITDIPLLRTTCHYGHALSGTTHYAGHPVFTDTTLLRTEATFPAETTKKSMEAILGTISDSSCYGIADTSCDLKPIFLFFSPYNGQLGPTK